MSDILDEKRPTRGDARRDAIVQAARKVCLEKGFSKITVSDIASEVGMTRSLFYHYFEDKEAVADAVLDNVIDEILTTLKQWNQARETRQREQGIRRHRACTPLPDRRREPLLKPYDPRRQRRTVYQVH